MSDYDYFWKTWLEEREAPRVAKEVVTALLDDLTNRRGLRHEWESIESGIQKEIMTQWLELTVRVLRSAFKDLL